MYFLRDVLDPLHRTYHACKEAHQFVRKDAEDVERDMDDLVYALQHLQDHHDKNVQDSALKDMLDAFETWTTEEELLRDRRQDAEKEDDGGHFYDEEYYYEDSYGIPWNFLNFILIMLLDVDPEAIPETSMRLPFTLFLFIISRSFN